MAVGGGLAGACAGSSFLVANTFVKQFVMKVIQLGMEEKRGGERWKLMHV